MQNEAQYDWDRKAAKISALSSNNLDKYEYLTGEDLGLKPSTIITTISWFFTSFTETFEALIIGHWSLNTMI